MRSVNSIVVFTFWLSLDRFNFPGFNYLIPYGVFSDSSAPSEIGLSPGETKQVSYVWDQRVRTQTADSAVGIGYYDLHANLTAGDFATIEVMFEVLVRSIPIGGVIITGQAGASNSSAAYTFVLEVRNWTSVAGNLHFPSTQTISVQLFDPGGLSPGGSPIYVNPASTDSTASVVALAPGGTRAFTSTADESRFGPWSMWTYAKIKLLCTDFSFARHGQLFCFRKCASL